MTNREWLNSLSDEEFLDVLTKIDKQDLICKEQGACVTNSCYDCQLDWLKKERVEEWNKNVQTVMAVVSPKSMTILTDTTYLNVLDVMVAE